MSDLNKHTLRAIFWLSCFFAFLFTSPLLFALALQDAAQVATQAATPPTGTSELTASLMWAFLSSSGLEWLKRNRSIRISLLQENTPWFLQRLLGFLTAFVTSLGISWAFDAQTGTFIISGLFLGNIAGALIDTLRQWVFQEVAYRISVKNYRPEVTT